jgi:hypothetical protein
MASTPPRFVAFAGHARIAVGTLPAVARAVRQRLDAGETAPIAVFDAATSAPVDLDLRGTPDEAAARAEAMLATRAAASKRRGPGRPRLGVVAREVTLLPRHWDWLNAQSGGASVALRKLVDAARKQNHGSDKIRRLQDVAHRFMFALAGDLPGFEEASRALYAWDLPRLKEQIAPWPEDVTAHVRGILDRPDED